MSGSKCWLLSLKDGDETGEEDPEFTKLKKLIKKIKKKLRQLDQADVLLEAKMNRNTESVENSNSVIKSFGETIKTVEQKQKKSSKLVEDMNEQVAGIRAERVPVTESQINLLHRTQKTEFTELITDSEFRNWNWEFSKRFNFQRILGCIPFTASTSISAGLDVMIFMRS